MEASVVILRDHPVNEERRSEGLKPANCLWLWGQGRAAEWPAITERYPVTGTVITASDVHRGVGLYAGFTAAEPPNSEWDNGKESFASFGEAAARELERHDLLYIHAGFPDEIRHDSDVKKKVECLQEFDRRLVGRLLETLEKHREFRLLVICDPAFHPGGVAPVLYALCEGPLRTRSSGKGFNEADATAGDAVPRDATKLLNQFLPRGA
jgi:2,3-bisphosphoglycerate-independent phosphoglycerate mutase